MRAAAYLSITLGLLLGGAIGNLIDRIRLGYVVDFVDAGIGDLRWYTFNVADTAISLRRSCCSSRRSIWPCRWRAERRSMPVDRSRCN